MGCGEISGRSGNEGVEKGGGGGGGEGGSDRVGVCIESRREAKGEEREKCKDSEWRRGVAAETKGRGRG